MAARDSTAKDGIRRLLRPFRRKKGESEDVPGHTNPEEDLPRELFEDVREELHKTIDSELMGPKGENGQRDFKTEFADRNLAKSVFRPEILSRLYKSLNENQHLSLNDLGEEKFKSRVEERMLHPCLAALIFAGCSASSVISFILKLAAPTPFLFSNNQPFEKLPLSQTQLGEIFGDDDGAGRRNFCSRQAIFSTAQFREGEALTIVEDSQRLPFLETEKVLGQGSFGIVYRTVIAPGHFLFQKDETVSSNVDEMPVARKEFKLSDPDSFEQERSTWEQILNSQTSNSAILRSYGSLVRGKDFSLFMPLADLDLKDYMDTKLPPQTTSDKGALIACAVSIAYALDFLHNGMRLPGLEPICCYHLDLKPRNILVFGKNNTDWRISDFGISRIRKGPEATAQELDGPFQLTDRGTQNQNGDSAYSAPESNDDRSHMTEASDVWSLGCIISELLTFMEMGKQGIEEYASKRRALNGLEGFSETVPMKRPQLKLAVKEWHRSLVESSRTRGANEGKRIEEFLKFLENDVLAIEMYKRATAAEVASKLRTLESHFGNDFKCEEHPNVEPKPTTKNRFKLWRGQLELWLLRRSSSHSTNILRWPLAATEEWRGCTIGTNDSVVAYWTSNKIMLYAGGTTFPPSMDKVPHIDVYSLPPSPKEPLRRFNSVSVTGDYLVAGTDSFEFTVITPSSYG